MERQKKENNNYKNDEANFLIVPKYFILEKDDYAFNSFHSENLEEDNNSSFEIDFPELHSKKLGKQIYSISEEGVSPSEKLEEEKNCFSFSDDIKFEGFHYNLIGDNENNSTSQNNYISSYSPETNQKIFKVNRNKRGRIKQKIELNKKRKEKTHNKNGKDNIIRKIQTSYFNFMIDFINIIIDLFKSKIKLYPKKKFIYIDYDIKRSVNKIQRKKILTNSIEEMIKNNNISKKNSKSSLTSNKDLYNEIKKYGIPEIVQIFKKKFIFLFDIYHKSIRKFNLKEIDENLPNLTIKIPENVELYQDLLDKNNGEANFEEYKALMEDYVKNYFDCRNLFCTKIKH